MDAGAGWVANLCASDPRDLHALLVPYPPPPPHKKKCMEFTHFNSFHLHAQTSPVYDRSREMAHRLIAAAQNGDITSVRRLVEGGTGVNATGEYGKTALHHAAER